MAFVTLIARSGLGIFSGQTVRKLGKLVPCEGSRQHALPAEIGVFYMSNGLIFLIFCSKQDLSTLLPNPLLSSAQRTHHSVFDEVVRAFELHLAR